MEVLKNKLIDLEKACKSLGLKVITFKQVKEEYEKANQPTELLDNYLTHRDSLIQRFEFSYDLTWKFLKEYLRQKFMIEVASPRKVFDACLKEKLINEQETKEFLKMIESRNFASHIYSYELMLKTVKKFPK